MKLSKNFYLYEFERSMTAIRMEMDNSVPEHLIPNGILLCENVLQPLRDKYGKSIYIASGYRCPSLNSYIGGAAFSQHKRFEAADIDTERDNLKLFNMIVENKLPFDQLIWEFGDERPEWIHVSYTSDPRGEILRASKVDGRTHYESIAA